jgi:hypothetical protein
VIGPRSGPRSGRIQRLWEAWDVFSFHPLWVSFFLLLPKAMENPPRPPPPPPLAGRRRPRPPPRRGDEPKPLARFLAVSGCSGFYSFSARGGALRGLSAVAGDGGGRRPRRRGSASVAVRPRGSSLLNVVPALRFQVPTPS